MADRLGLPYKTIKRKFAAETEKRAHVIKLNLARRHLDGIRWGKAFKLLCEERGADFGGKGGRPTKENHATVAQLAEELGVPLRTSQHRVAQADAYEALPKKQQKAIDKGETTQRGRASGDTNRDSVYYKWDGYNRRLLPQFGRTLRHCHACIRDDQICTGRHHEQPRRRSNGNPLFSGNVRGAHYGVGIFC